MSEYSDVELVCSDCNQTFVFSAEEQERYASRNFSEPKRCPECRQNRRTQHRQAPRRFGGGAAVTAAAAVAMAAVAMAAAAMAAAAAAAMAGAGAAAMAAVLLGAASKRPGR